MKYKCVLDFESLNLKIGDIVNIEKSPTGYNIENHKDCFDSETIKKHFSKIRLEGWIHSPYSHSKMETWTSCPKKFEFNYIINPPRIEVPNPVLEKGTLFHGILEFDMSDKLDNFELPDTFKALSKNDAEEIINKALLFTEESDTYKWIKSLKGKKVSEQEMFLGKNLEPVDSIEKSLIRGFIDLIIYDKDSKSCYIFDWKTGGKSKEDLKKWPKAKDQLELYAIWANQMYDVEYIETAFIYVEHDHMAKYTFEKNDIQTLKTKFKNKINNIEEDKTFKKNLTQLCAWCDFKELCLGIDASRNPREISKDEILNAGKNKLKDTTRNHKNTSFLNKIKQRNA
jgi:CRISPR/Cas system-associated exonuclease Cas4 (RecB family)